MKFTLGDLNLGSCPPIPYKYLYLWSNHRTKDVRWWLQPPYKWIIIFGIINEYLNCFFIIDDISFYKFN